MQSISPMFCSNCLTPLLLIFSNYTVIYNIHYTANIVFFHPLSILRLNFPEYQNFIALSVKYCYNRDVLGL